MLILQLLSDPGLGHCNRIIRYSRTEYAKMEQSIILVPDCKKIIAYLTNQKVHNFLIYSVHKPLQELIQLLENKLDFKEIKEWVIDTKLDCSDLLHLLKKRKVFSTLIDNKTDSRFLSDKNIYPTPLFEKSELDWIGYNGIVEGGFDTDILRSLSSLKKKHKLKKKQRKEVLISFGGEDPNQLTNYTMKSLFRLETEVEITVVIGPLFQHKKEIQELNVELEKRYKFIENSSDLSQFILNADCLITAVGATIFEGLVLGTPCIVISNFLSDNLDEKKLEKMNNVSVLGYYANVFENKNFLLDEVRVILNGPI